MKRLTAKVGDKTYTAQFKKPSLDTLEAVYNYLDLEPFMADVTLARECFVEGDKEMIDFDNHIEVFMEYKERLGELVEMYESEVVKVAEVPEQYRDENAWMYVKVTKGETDYYGAFSKPKFKTTRRVLDLYDKQNTFAGDRIIHNDCILKGDIEIRDAKQHPEFFLSIKRLLSEILHHQSESLKKN